jgi:hypothetical protein
MVNSRPEKQKENLKMKTPARLLVVTGLTLCAAFWALSGTAHAQIFVANLGDGTIGEYNLDGSTVNASLISGLDKPYGIAVSGGDLFVANNGNGTIGEYNLDGTPINASLISGLGSPTEIAVSGGDLFVVNTAGSEGETIGEYTTSGVTVNAALITKGGGGGGNPLGFAVSGGDLFVENLDGDEISEYNIDGTLMLIKTSLIPGLSNPLEITVSGNDLFVQSSGKIGEYTTSGGTINATLVSAVEGTSIAVSGGGLFVAHDNTGTIIEYTTSGALVNAALVSGLDGPLGIAVVIPEPTTLALTGLGGLSLMLFRRRRR